MDLGMEDVVELLNVSESTVKRWLKEGTIPSYRLQEQVRFNRAEIESWLMQHSVEEESSHCSGGMPFGLYRAICRGGVLSDVAAKNKWDLIASVSPFLAKKLDIDADILAELLIEREKLMSTALSHGIAVPHARDFLLQTRTDLVTLVSLQEPIAYGALDGEPVHTLFFLFASEDKRHLRLLAKIAHLAGSAEAATFLRSERSAPALLESLKQWESHCNK